MLYWAENHVRADNPPRLAGTVEVKALFCSCRVCKAVSLPREEGMEEETPVYERSSQVRPPRLPREAGMVAPAPRATRGSVTTLTRCWEQVTPIQPPVQHSPAREGHVQPVGALERSQSALQSPIKRGEMRLASTL